MKLENITVKVNAPSLNFLNVDGERVILKQNETYPASKMKVSDLIYFSTNALPKVLADTGKKRKWGALPKLDLLSSIYVATTQSQEIYRSSISIVGIESTTPRQEVAELVEDIEIKIEEKKEEPDSVKLSRSKKGRPAKSNS